MRLRRCTDPPGTSRLERCAESDRLVRCGDVPCTLCPDLPRTILLRISAVIQCNGVCLATPSSSCRLYWSSGAIIGDHYLTLFWGQPGVYCDYRVNVGRARFVAWANTSCTGSPAYDRVLDILAWLVITSGQFELTIQPDTSFPGMPIARYLKVLETETCPQAAIYPNLHTTCGYEGGSFVRAGYGGRAKFVL